MEQTRPLIAALDDKTPKGATPAFGRGRNESREAATMSRTALALWPVALFILTSCSSTNTPPAVGSERLTYVKGVPGGVIVQTVKLTATVTAIDHAQRTATLLVPDGKRFAVRVGREAVNFDQIGVGDQITANVTQRIVASVEQDGVAPADEAVAVVARAPQGGQPGALAAETTRLTAKVIATDVAKHTATLEFEDGIIQTFTRADVDMTRLKLGDKVVFHITEMVAIWVDKPQ